MIKARIKLIYFLSIKIPSVFYLMNEWWPLTFDNLQFAKKIKQFLSSDFRHLLLYVHFREDRKQKLLISNYSTW